MHARHLVVGLSALLLLAAACGTPESTAPVVPLAAPVAAPAPAAGPETVTVASVDDGDTFTLTDGRKVRVLGIDSCESTTRAGRSATADAGALIDGRTVTLLPEAGVNLDPYGRALRYVTVPDGRDLGTIMVARPHTTVYEGGDAAASYVSALRALDDGPATCGAATTTATPQPATPQPVRRAAPTVTPAPRYGGTEARPRCRARPEAGPEAAARGRVGLPPELHAVRPERTGPGLPRHRALRPRRRARLVPPRRRQGRRRLRVTGSFEQLR